jgi:aspartate kinase
MATLGSRVLHGRSVELARKYHVPLTVAAAVGSGMGTRVEERSEAVDMESVVVRAVSQDAAVQKVSMIGVPDQPGVAAKIFSTLGAEGIHVRLIVQAQSHDGTNDITFVASDDERLSQALLRKVVDQVGGQSFLLDRDVGLLSVIGEGITREPGIPGRIFSILADARVNLDLISTSNLVITCVVSARDLDRGAMALHEGMIEAG